jgi:hypothetical protein
MNTQGEGGEGVDAWLSLFFLTSALDGKGGPRDAPAVSIV